MASEYQIVRTRTPSGTNLVSVTEERVATRGHPVPASARSNDSGNSDPVALRKEVAALKAQLEWERQEFARRLQSLGVPPRAAAAPPPPPPPPAAPAAAFTSGLASVNPNSVGPGGYGGPSRLGASGLVSLAPEANESLLSSRKVAQPLHVVDLRSRAVPAPATRVVRMAPAAQTRPYVRVLRYDEDHPRQTERPMSPPRNPYNATGMVSVRYASPPRVEITTSPPRFRSSSPQHVETVLERHVISPARERLYLPATNVVASAPYAVSSVATRHAAESTRVRWFRFD